MNGVQFIDLFKRGNDLLEKYHRAKVAELFSSEKFKETCESELRQAKDEYLEWYLEWRQEVIKTGVDEDKIPIYPLTD